jgi:hypothetical protein
MEQRVPNSPLPAPCSVLIHRLIGGSGRIDLRDADIVCLIALFCGGLFCENTLASDSIR